MRTVILSILLSISFTYTAHAALILEYTGPLFTFFDGGVTNPMDGTERVTAQITLDPSITTLTNGLNIMTSDVTTFSLSALGRTIDSNNPDITFSSFDIVIGPLGLPTDWILAVEANLEGASMPETIASQAPNFFPNFLRDVFAIDDALPGNVGESTSTLAISEGQNRASATWTVVPTPSALLLMGTGLLGLIGYRKWSNKTN